MDRDKFFSEAGGRLGSMSQDARGGAELILDEAERRQTELNDLAYMLATAWWETARAMRPVKEAYYLYPNDDQKAEQWRKKNLHYYPYYGRGLVQLTWKTNYRKASDAYGQNFVTNPDGVLDPEIAVKVMFDGMAEGWFTGKSLDDYIDDIDEADNADLKEYIEARRVINGKDKAKTIAAIALAFEAALKAAGYAGSAQRLIGTAGRAAGSAAGSAFDQHIAGLGLRHFKAYEFLVKGSQHDNPNSDAYGLNTDPPQSHWANIDLTARVLDELRHRLQRPIVMSSVYRSSAYNAAIGGAKKSQHVDFNAIDFSVVGSPVGPTQWATALRAIRSAGMFRGGIGVYATFVHLDTRGTNVDWVG